MEVNGLYLAGKLAMQSLHCQQSVIWLYWNKFFEHLEWTIVSHDLQVKILLCIKMNLLHPLHFFLEIVGFLIIKFSWEHCGVFHGLMPHCSSLSECSGNVSLPLANLLKR